MKYKVILLVLVTSLYGCSTTPIVHNPKMLPEPELAKISTEDIGAWLDGDELFTSFMKVWDVDGKEIAAKSFMSDLPSTFILSEGKYQFSIKCANSNGIGGGVYSFGRLYPDIKAGKEYIVYCLSRTEKNFLGIPMIKQMAPFVSPKESYEKERANNVIIFKSLKIEK